MLFSQSRIMGLAKVGVAGLAGTYASERWLIDYSGTGKKLVNAAPGMGADDAVKVGCILIVWLFLDMLL